jgi:DNA (cytosine-5)-methyltransferase 1
MFSVLKLVVYCRIFPHSKYFFNRNNITISMPYYLRVNNLDSRAPIMGRKIHTLVDLFAGCGGLGLGFHQAGFETVLANELHPDPAETYVQNLLQENSERMLVGNISEVLTNEVLRKLKSKYDEITCVSGGPPCQGFSMAGAGNANDPRNNLYREYLRVIRVLQPQTVVFENVPEFATRYGIGLQNHLQKTLISFGYSLSMGVIRAMDYGVPQLRRRFICIGIKKSILKNKDVILPPSTWTLEEIKAKLTSKKVLDDLDVYIKRGGYGTGENIGPEKYLKPARSDFQKSMRQVSGTTVKGVTWNTLIPRHTKNVQLRMEMYQKGVTRSELLNTKLATKKLSQRVLFADKPPQITVVSLPDDYIHYNTELPRTLSVRECARLQTFPDHFRFYGKRTTGGLRRRTDVPQYTQVGNAIPPRLAKSIAMHLLNYISVREDFV